MIARLLSVRMIGDTKGHYINRNSYEDIQVGISDLMSSAGNSAFNIICIDDFTQEVISVTPIEGDEDEDGREQALNDIAEALEKGGHEVTF